MTARLQKGLPKYFTLLIFGASACSVNCCFWGDGHGNLTMQVSRSWYSSFIEYQNNEKVMWLKSSYIKFQSETNQLVANLMMSTLTTLFFFLIIVGWP